MCLLVFLSQSHPIHRAVGSEWLSSLWSRDNELIVHKDRQRHTTTQAECTIVLSSMVQFDPQLEWCRAETGTRTDRETDGKE